MIREAQTSLGVEPVGPAAQRPVLSRLDHMLGALFGLWMIVGLFLDGWAHDNQKPESFFTPWHGVLYSGFAAAAAFALDRALRDREPGRPMRETMPRGHGLTLVALAVFGVAATGDLAWHELFGIEVGLEALLSPTHLLLMASGLVALSAPVRAAWLDLDEEPSSREFLPVALAVALETALVAFFLSFFSPFSNNAAGTAFSRRQGQEHSHPSSDVHELQQLVGVGSILLMSVVIAGAVALLLRRWRTPAGTLSLLFGLLVVLFTGTDDFAQPLVLLAGLAAGVAGDALVRWRAPAAYVSAGSIAVLWLSYFALYAIDEGSVSWSAEVWAGTAFLSALLAGGIGLLVTPLPRTATER
ncbi:hypothetical protein HC251_18660 [Iamia sp. SCSIO 61187]|uniref:hypothetical protein n=1 Tax=Iamia sp. SCSIO 61187 TaxID=2722752 RepID=UPI001C62C35E|nr:hypothetical protein [Iamia sp. SCSIO 61187]QYG94258.1 hypothetical protein HC251_18660 [Iamia sp. SCSIO 61187]